MQIKIDIPDHVIAGALEAAFKHIGYWASFALSHLPEGMSIEQARSTLSGNRTLLEFCGLLALAPLVPNGCTTLTDTDTGLRHELTRAKLEAGLVLMADKYPHKFQTLLCRDYDGRDGDVLVQCALFPDGCRYSF